MTTNAFLLQQTWLIITQNGASSPYWLKGGKCSSRGTTCTHSIAWAHSKSSRSASLLSHQLSSSSYCAALSSSAGCCVISQCAAIFLSHRPRRAALSSSRRLIVPPSCCLVMPAGCRIISHHPLVMPPSCSLIVPAGCCVASSCTPLSSSRRAGHLCLAITLP